jgi:two-component system LytT family response regulator
MDIIIIDDEVKARSLIRNIMLQSSYNSIGKILEAENLREGVQLIKEHHPQVVLLDIEMPNEQGIEILNYFDTDAIDFELVFTTAYSEYAVQAFEMNAIDYILKPIRPKRLMEVINRIKESFDRNDIQNRLEELRKSLKEHNFNKIGLPVVDGIEFVPIDSIVHLKAEGMYTHVFTLNENARVVSKPLKFFDVLLDSGKTFYRPHRSHIVNLTFLKNYVRTDGNYIVLENGGQIPISKEKKDEFLNLVTQL